MAGFNTHLGGGAISAGIFSSSLLMTGVFHPVQIALVWLAGTLGGLLPDIDSDSSIVLKGMFTTLGVIASFAALLLFRELPLLQLWGVMLSAFILVRFVVMAIFARFTTHRGAYHSVLAALFSGMATVFLAHRLFSVSIDLSWAMGLSVSIGFLTHLILDEAYSVDLSGAELKRSFGTALKLFSIKQFPASVLMAIITLSCWWAIPKPEGLYAAVMNERVSEVIVDSVSWLQKENQRILGQIKDRVAKN